MRLTPDEIVFWEHGFITINMTIVATWVIMLVMVIGSALITRKLKSGIIISRWQCILEMIVVGLSNQIKDTGLTESRKYIGFLGTLFLFITLSNICIIFPLYEAPTGSLSTTAALAVSVFFAVPWYGIKEGGILGYLKSYTKPSFVMIPFNIIGEITRTIALAVRLFGNIMSGGLIVAIMFSVAPIVFPMIINILGVLTGIVQAYIFAVLATVFVAASVQESRHTKE